MFHKRGFSMCSMLMLIATAMISGPASATLIVEAQGTVDDCFSFSCDLIPFGTVVDASLEFDASGSAPSSPMITSVSGAFTWDDGIPRSFSVSAGFLSSVSSTGVVSLLFDGPALDLGGKLLDSMNVIFDIGTNPFASTDPWDSLLLGASIEQMGLGGVDPATGNGFGCGACIAGNFSGSVSRASVPEPGTIALLSLGLAGLGVARHKRKT